MLSLADLRAWSFSGTALAVVGHPVAHSISPAMHNAALVEMARREPRFESWRYFRFDVPPGELTEALARLHAQGFHGINLTVPHKVPACELVEKIDAAARPIGAVNTLHRTPTGWAAFNTDGYGLATAVREAFSRELSGTAVILLGAGGAARGAAVECLQRGCASLAIGNRTPERLNDLLGALAAFSPAAALRGFDPSRPPRDLPQGALVINATSAGLKPDDPAPIDLAAVPTPCGVYDMIYNPPLTPLLAAARARGLPWANGLSMLVHQGVRSLEIWTGASVPVEVMRSAAFAAL